MEPRDFCHNLALEAHLSLVGVTKMECLASQTVCDTDTALPRCAGCLRMYSSKARLSSSSLWTGKLSACSS